MNRKITLHKYSVDLMRSALETDYESWSEDIRCGDVNRHNMNSLGLCGELLDMIKNPADQTILDLDEDQYDFLLEWSEVWLDRADFTHTQFPDDKESRVERDGYWNLHQEFRYAGPFTLYVTTHHEMSTIGFALLEYKEKILKDIKSPGCSGDEDQEFLTDLLKTIEPLLDKCRALTGESY